MFGRTFTKGGAIGYLTEDFGYTHSDFSHTRNIINIEKLLASSSPITADILFDAVAQHRSDMNPDNLKLLLEKAFAQKDIEPNIKSASFTGDTLLNAAIHSYDIVKFLLEKGANPNILSIFKKTALYKIIVEDNITEQNRILVTKLLLQYGALTEFKNLQGWTVIQSAVYWKRIEIVKLLILSGANLNVIIPENPLSLHSGKNLIQLVSKKTT